MPHSDVHPYIKYSKDRYIILYSKLVLLTTFGDSKHFTSSLFALALFAKKPLPFFVRLNFRLICVHSFVRSFVAVSLSFAVVDKRINRTTIDD